jgi:hypothetical protein
MTEQRGNMFRWLMTVVAAHFAISILHAIAHDRAAVPLSRAATLYVLLVILAGPLVGGALVFVARRLGMWLLALTMAGALVFGVVNHFMVSSADHVAHVAPVWRPLFASTAVLLALTEALGAGLAFRLAQERRDR